MIDHFFTMLIRTIRRNKSYALINLAGLVIAMTTSMLIFLYVWHEKSYDQFHHKKDRLFRVRNDRFTNGELTRRWAAGPMSIGSDLKRDFPEVVRFVRMSNARRQSYILDHGERSFKEENILYASEDFFKVFSFRLITSLPPPESKILFYDLS